MRTTWWIVLLLVLLAAALAVAGAWGVSSLVRNRVSAAPNGQFAPQPGVPGWRGGLANPPDDDGGWGRQMPGPGRMHPWSDRMPGPFGRDGSRRMPMMPGGRNNGLNRGTW